MTINFVVEPGGPYTLFANARIGSDPVTPDVELINNQTGQVTPVPRLTAMLAATGVFTQILWRPGSSQALIATGYAPAPMQYTLYDVATGGATPLALPSGLVRGWSPDGGTLIMSSRGPTQTMYGVSLDALGDIGEVGGEPYTLTAVQVSANGVAGAPVILTTHAVNVPLLGFIHTA